MPDYLHSFRQGRRLRVKGVATRRAQRRAAQQDILGDARDARRLIIHSAGSMTTTLPPHSQGQRQPRGSDRVSLEESPNPLPPAQSAAARPVTTDDSHHHQQPPPRRPGRWGTGRIQRALEDMWDSVRTLEDEDALSQVTMAGWSSLYGEIRQVNPSDAIDPDVLNVRILLQVMQNTLLDLTEGRRRR